MPNIEKNKLGDLGRTTSCESAVNFRDEKIYFTGGTVHVLKLASAKVVEFDLKTGVSREMPSMIQGRLAHASCILNEKLYVIGGVDKI